MFIFNVGLDPHAICLFFPNRTVKLNSVRLFAIMQKIQLFTITVGKCTENRICVFVSFNKTYSSHNISILQKNIASLLTKILAFFGKQASCQNRK